MAAGLLLAGAYVVHVIGIVLAARGSTWGYAINPLMGLGWFLGAVLDHLPDVLSAAPYRAGFPSKALEVGIIGIAALLVIVSTLALRQPRA